MPEPLCTLVLAAGAPWESAAFSRLTAERGVVVLKRCVDVDDLLAAATSGQADVAVVALDAPGLDAAAVAHLRRHGVRPVGVLSGDRTGDVAAALGIEATTADDELDTLVAAVLTAGESRAEPPPPQSTTADRPPAAGEHRVVAVWGPAGAPGRTTTAVTLAAELARRNGSGVLVDLDPYGGSVAQQLGILDEASGLLAAARLAGSGRVAERFGSVCRSVEETMWVVTGLPRADRWREVRPEALEQVLAGAAEHGTVVLDTGFSLEDDAADPGGRPGRNAMTTTALDVADEVVVVGSADPVGLSRLARALVELRERSFGGVVRVVVNRMRPGLGWSEKEIVGMVEGFARTSGVHFVPDDREHVDRALVSGRSLVEVGDGPALRAFGHLADVISPESAPAPVRRRRAGRAHRR